MERFEAEEHNLIQLQELIDLSKQEEDPSLVLEIKQQLEKIAFILEQIEFTAMLSGSYDRSAALLSINAGAGGVDAQDFADILKRMYLRWCEKKGYTVEELDLQEGEEAGIKSCTYLIKGDAAYGYLKGESGVHRLVRISPFDSNARRHTSFAAVFVYPEIDDDVEVDIREEDLEIQTMRSGGAGGQHVNKTESAVRILHKPSGFVVKCQSERSQHQNKARALKMLRAMLYDKKQKEQESKLQQAHDQKKAIEWGSQIRSYVLAPYQMVADHRIDFKIGNVQSVLDGNLDELVQAYLRTVTRK